MNKFHIGQRIVCINNSGCHPLVTKPIINETYTIRELFVDGNIIGIHLVEIVNPQRHCRTQLGTIEFSESGYLSSRFVPLSEKTAESEAFASETLKMIEHEIIETYTLK